MIKGFWGKDLLNLSFLYSEELKFKRSFSQKPFKRLFGGFFVELILSTLILHTYIVHDVKSRASLHPPLGLLCATRTGVTFRVACAGLHSNWAHVNSKFSDACLAYPITCLGHPGRVIVCTWHSDAVSVPGHHAAAVNSGSYLKTPFTYRHEPFMHV